MLKGQQTQSEKDLNGDVTTIVGGLEEVLREKVQVERQHNEIEKRKVDELQATRKELERRNTFLLHLSSTIENIDNTLRFSISPGMKILMEYQEVVGESLRLVVEALVRGDANEDQLHDLMEKLDKIGSNITINTGTAISSGGDTNIESGRDIEIKG